MTPIKLLLDKTGGVREWQAEFRYDVDTKDLVKSLGFRWNPGSKTWKTLDVKVAKRLAEHLKETPKQEELEVIESVVEIADQEAFKMSRGLEPVGDINIPTPDGLEYSPYQLAMVEWCLQRYQAGRENLICSDEMGIGKTMQAIGLIQKICDKSSEVLIICPASLKINWQREFRKWDTLGLTVKEISGTGFLTEPTENVVIINYDILLKQRTKNGWYCKDWDLIICDEAHYLKEPKAKRTVGVLGGSAKIQQGKPPARFYPLSGKKLFLTGTPMVNRPIELWPMLQACDPTDLGLDWFKYIREYCDAHRTRYGWDRKGASNLGRLQAKMRSSIMIRRRSVDVLTQLPPIRRQAIVLPADSYLNLIRAEWRAFNKYESVLAELEQARENLDGDQDNLRELVKNLTDSQSLAWSELAKARKDVGLAKVDHTLKHVQHMIDSRGKVVLFSWHRDVVEQLMTGLEKERLNPVRLTGADSLMVRQTSVDKFQNDPVVKVIVLNLEAGGVGITLTGSDKAGFCTSVVFSELDWRPSTMAQAEARVWRRSVDESAQNVLVHHIVIDGSLDANISNKLLDKQDVIDQAIN